MKACARIGHPLQEHPQITGSARGDRTRPVKTGRNRAPCPPHTQGARHKPSSPGGARILVIEPTGTSTVGDPHEEVPDHVDATTGHPLAA